MVGCEFEWGKLLQGHIMVNNAVTVIFKISLSETARPIKAKCLMESPWEGETRVNTNCPGHVSKMADTPIYVYGKSLKKSSPEPEGR